MTASGADTAAAPCRAVHLDLKGLPPTPARLLELLSIFRGAGFNAVLVEWEDMFPWTVDERFRGPTCYTPEIVGAFADRARELGLELIPLVQCLGHMETPLVLPEYAAMRERPDRCDGLNPLAEGAGELVRRMVEDVLVLMPGVKRFHLGGDEAWSFATAPDTRAFAEKHGKDRLYLQHLEPILDQLHQRDIRPLLWHDMMIDWADESIRALAGRADLVVWGYVGHPDDADHHFNTRYIERFDRLGVTLWGAGAFKGADGMSIDLPDLDQRMTNARAWADLHRRFGFAGLIATGWSRYSCHRVQCEPLDAALDALVRVGRLWRDGVDPGHGGAIDVLRNGNQADRFERCRAALDAFSRHRLAAWQAVRETWENIALARLDTDRVGSGILDTALDGLDRETDQLVAAGQTVERQWRGLVDERWVREYVAVRTRALEQQRADLRAAESGSQSS